MGIREFSRKVSRAIDEVETSGRPAVLTRHGRPVVAVIPLDADGFEDFVLAHVPEYALAMRAADEELERGETRTVEEVFDEGGGETTEQDPPRQREAVGR